MPSTKKQVKKALDAMPSDEVQALRDWVRLHEDKPEDEVVESLAQLWLLWTTNLPTKAVRLIDHRKLVRELKASDRARQRLGSANAKLMDQIIVLKRDLAFAHRELRAKTKKTKK
jgi:hypothetical protein